MRIRVVALLLACLTSFACGGDITIRGAARCDGVLQSEEDTVDSPFDSDGDGFFDGSNPDCAETYEYVDCDDRLPGVRPDADELLCNDLDDDCDPTTPDALDGDQDGADSCVDCNDSDANNFPGNPEI